MGKGPPFTAFPQNLTVQPWEGLSVPPSFRGEGEKKTLTPSVLEHSVPEHAFIYCPQSPFLWCPFIQYQMLTWPSPPAFGMANLLLCWNWTVWWFTCGLTRNPIQIWLWLLKLAALFQGKRLKLEGNESTMESCWAWWRNSPAKGQWRSLIWGI